MAEITGEGEEGGDRCLIDLPREYYPRCGNLIISYCAYRLSCTGIVDTVHQLPPPVWDTVNVIYSLFHCAVFIYRAGIFKQSMGARNRVGIGLSYRPARLQRIAEFIPLNRFPGSIKA
jgi:hypothetical protein